MKSPLVRYGILIIAWILWYSLFYSSIKAKVKQEETRVSALKIRLSSIQREVKNCRKEGMKLAYFKKSISALRAMAIEGGDPQVVASNLQNMILTYASQKNIEVETYRTGSPTKWKNYRVARTTFTFKCNRENFVELLRFFEETKRLVRPKRLNILWIRGRNSYIRVVLDVEALCVNKKEKKGNKRQGVI